MYYKLSIGTILVHKNVWHLMDVGFPEISSRLVRTTHFAIVL